MKVEEEEEDEMVMVEGNEDSGKDLKSEEIVKNGTLLEKKFDGAFEFRAKLLHDSSCS